jgi:hypothetical protein
LSIFVGGSEITEIKIGSTTINEVYVGSTLVWSAGDAVTLSLTQGVAGGGIVGYGPGYGSINPSTFKDVAFFQIAYFTFTSKNGNVTRSFFLQFPGNRAQNFFTSISESSLGTLTSSSAARNYDSANNRTTFQWSLFSSPSNWDGSGVLTVDVA